MAPVEIANESLGIFPSWPCSLAATCRYDITHAGRAAPLIDYFFLDALADAVESLEQFIPSVEQAAPLWA